MIRAAATAMLDRRAESPNDSRRGLRQKIALPTDANARAKVALATLVVAALAWRLSISSIHPERSTDLGLVGQLPVLWWVSLGLVAMALWFGVREAERTATSDPSRMPEVLLILGTVLFTVILHGTASAAESLARFPTAYEHVGFTQYIATTGHTLPRLDARMSWPGFFAGAGFLARAMDVNPTWFLKWAPLVSNLAYLLPLKVIADATLRTTRARWAALWLFIGANWVGQDYFSPQGANFFLYLVAIAILYRILGSARDSPSWVKRLQNTHVSRVLERVARRVFSLPQETVPGEQSQIALRPRDRVLVSLMLYVIVFASVASHQLTPVVIGVVAALLALIGRVRTRGLWLLCIVAVAAWTSFAAITYWSGHLSSVVGSAGQITSTLDQNVAVRLHGSADRLFVLRARIVLAVLLWLGSALSFLLALRSGRSHWTLLALLVGPFAVIGGFTYGGEAVLRVYLFSLPAAAILIALLLDQLPQSARRPSVLAKTLPPYRYIAWGLLAVVVVALFPIARWGNEEFEYVSVGDVQAIEWVYTDAPLGATLVSANPVLPWRYAHIDDYLYVTIESLQFPLSQADVVALVKRLRIAPTLRHAFLGQGAPTYVILTRSQAGYATAQYGISQNWMRQLIGVLERSGAFRVVYRNSDAAIVRLLPR